MSENTELKKSCMGFELPDGKKFFLHHEDVHKIAQEIFLHLVGHDQTKIYMLGDKGLERARLLYETFKKEKEHMNDKIKEEYLKNILKYTIDNDFELRTLEKEITQFNSK